MDKDTLASMYVAAGSVSALARQLGVPTATLRCRLVRLGIPLMARGYRSPHPPAHHGPEHHNWAGGTYQLHSGYIFEYAPDHPASASRKGYVAQHRLVMERHLGRLLTSAEVVHHINGNKSDNRLSNLCILSRRQHIHNHKAETPRDEKGRFVPSE